MRVNRFALILVLCVVVSGSGGILQSALARDTLLEYTSPDSSLPRQVGGPPGPGDPLVQPAGTPPVSQPQPASVEPVISPAPAPPASPIVVSVAAPTLSVPYRPLTCGLLTDFEQFGTWTRGDEPNGTFIQSAEQRYSGTYSGKLDYNFPTQGNDYVVFRRTIPMGGYGTAVTAWVYGDNSGHYLSAWIEDAAGEIWSFPFGQIQHTGWQQMTAPLDVKAPWPTGSLVGPQNGLLDHPISFYALVLDDAPDTYMGSGAIYVDDLSCSEAFGPQVPPAPAIIPNASLTGNLGGLIGGTLGDLLKTSAVGGQTGGVQPGGGQTGGAQPGGGQTGGAQPGGGQTGGAQPGGGQTGGAQPGGGQTGGVQTGGSANCALTVLTPSKNYVEPTVGQMVLMEWKLNRPLAPDEYYFVVVVYPRNGQLALAGTFSSLSTPGQEIMAPQRYSKFGFSRTTLGCSDDGKYSWQVQVRRQQGAAPDKADPVLCFESGVLTWRPWAHCPGPSSVSVQPTDTPAAPPVFVSPTDTPSAPVPPPPPPPVAGGPTPPFIAPPCGLTLMSPNHGTKFGPEQKPLSLVWHYDRPLPENQYFFAEVLYLKKKSSDPANYLGTWHQVGSYKDAANGEPEELRWAAEKHGTWTVPDMLCLPGFSPDGWYKWTVSVREKVMALPSSYDKVICQSDEWYFNWSGCQHGDTSTCNLTLLTPGNNEQLNPLNRAANLGWQLNRALAPDEYFFVEIRYTHEGQPQRYGSWGENGYISDLRDPNFAAWQPYILCSDDGWYEWTVKVGRRQGAQPSATDPIVCESASGRFQWAQCDPMKPTPAPPAPQQPAQPATGCQVTQLAPPNGAQFGPETGNVVLQWQLNRALGPNEYFFANVEFPHGGQTWYDGTWRDAGQQLPDGTRDTSFALRNHLCQPGFSDTGQYTWYVVVLHQLGAEKSLSDGFVCRSDKRVFSWTGCAPPPPPEPEYPDDDYDYDEHDYD